MEVILIYLVKLAICLFFFTVISKLILQKDTFHKLNRIMWLAIILLSIILPAIQWNISSESPMIITVPNEYIVNISNIVSSNAAEPIDTPFSIVNILLLTYFSVVVFLTIRMVISQISLIKWIKSHKTDNLTAEYKDLLNLCKTNCNINRRINLIVHNEDLAPFSWMNYIVVSNTDIENNGYEILCHEIVHIKAYHSYDIILVNLLCIFQFFNPAAYLCKKALKEVHEYNADESVINLGINSKEYQLLLIKKVAGQHFSQLSNCFNQCKIKKRIIMMTKKKSSKWAIAKCLYIIPLALCTITVFANNDFSNELENLSTKESNNSLNTSKSDSIIIGNEYPTIFDSKNTLYIPDLDPKGKISAVIDGRTYHGKDGVFRYTQTESQLGEQDVKGVINVKPIIMDSYTKEFYAITYTQTVEQDVRGVLNASTSLGPKSYPFELNRAEKRVTININNDKNPDEQETPKTTITKLPDDHKTSQGTVTAKTPPITITILEETDGKAHGIAISVESGDEIDKKLQEKHIEVLQKFAKWVGANVVYPKDATDAKIEGKVIASFQVNKDGSIENIKIEKSPNKLLSDAVIDVIKKAPKFEKQDLNIKCAIPVSFVLDNTK